MWLQFPSGTERVSVQRQNFEVEFKDSEGKCYGRVPNALAPLLTQGMGFRAVDTPPEGAPADFAPADPLRDTAIAALSQENEVLKTDTGNLRADLMSMRAELTALTNERDVLKAKLDKAEARIVELEEEKE